MGADDSTTLNQIIDSLISLANPRIKNGSLNNEKALSLKVGKVNERIGDAGDYFKKRPVVLILGAGRVCRPAAEFLASVGNVSSSDFLKVCQSIGLEEIKEFQVIVASLYKKDADEVCLASTPLYISGETLRCKQIYHYVQIKVDSYLGFLYILTTECYHDMKYWSLCFYSFVLAMPFYDSCYSQDSVIALSC